MESRITFFKKLSNWQNYRRSIKQKARVFSHLIKSGFYLIDGCTFKRVNFFSIKVKNTFYIKGSGQITLFQIREGTEKIVFISTNDAVLHFKNLDFEIINLVKENEKKLLLPHIHYKSVDNIHHLVIADLVEGSHFNDDKHFFVYLNFLVNNLPPKSKCFVSNCTIYYIQHGDVAESNICWANNGNEPILLDIENVGLYPCFYDIFIFISRAQSPSEKLLFLLAEYKKELSYFIQQFNQTFDMSTVDYYLSLFIKTRSKCWDKKRENVSDPILKMFENDRIRKDFKNSLSLLKSLLDELE